jgi:hypothetical protein
MLREVLLATTLAATLTTLVAAVSNRVRPGPRALLLLLAIWAGGAAAGVAVGDRTGAVLAALAASCLPLVTAALGRPRDWFSWPRLALAALLQAAVLYLLYAALVVPGTATTAAGIAVGAVLWLIQLAALGLSLTFAYEVLDVLGRRSFPAAEAVTAAGEPDAWPAVCIQIPAYNEPPELLEQTIRQALRQDYPGRWMVQVVDNNTPDEATWRPIEGLCLHLGERVQFLHLDDWPGFKAGALNEGLRRLPSWVEAIAVVDADYLVEPDFLRATARHLTDPAVAFVQTPQHYRDWDDDSYLAGLFHSYRYFFDVPMRSRHEHNAIIFGGTMGLIRRSALEQIGGWDEWCITEDAEASLRLLALGYRGVYDPTPYGSGLMPLNLDGLKKQRFRWAFGGVQIMRKHWRLLLVPSRRGGLRTVQRLGYLVGGGQWFQEVLTVLFTLLLVATALVDLTLGRSGLPSLQGAVLIVPPLLVANGLLRSQWALRTTSRCTRRQAIRAQLVLFALSWVVMRACVAGLLRSSGTFLRTPKVRESRAWQRAVHASRAETITASICIVAAALLAWRHTGAGPVVAAGFLLMQAVIYLSAPLCGLWAEGVQLTPARVVFARSAQSTGERPSRRRLTLRLGLGAAIAAASLVAVGLAIASPAARSAFPDPSILGGGPSFGDALEPPHTSEEPTGADGAHPSPGSSASAVASPSPGASGQAPGATATPRPTATARTTPSATPAPTATATPLPAARPSGTPSPRPTSHPTPTPPPPP